MNHTPALKPLDYHEEKSKTIYQVSLLQGLTYGDYYGSVAIAELKKHGDTGIGTFHRLNGELIMLDGEVYRAAGDGSVEVVSGEETTPFCVVAFMDADTSENLKDIPDYNTLERKLIQIVAEKGQNQFYMIRIDGTFRNVHVRSVYAQKEPYQRLVEVLKRDQTFFDYENVEGTLIGLYCPPYMSALNATGWHLHFISSDKSKGGHVLGVNIADAALNMCSIDAFEVHLPRNKMFSGLDLTVDQSEDIERVEKNQLN